MKAPLDAEPHRIGATALDFECTGLELSTDQPGVLIARGPEQRCLLEITPPDSEHEGDR